MILIVPEDPAGYFDVLRREDEIQQRRTALPSLLRKALQLQRRQLAAGPRG